MKIISVSTINQLNFPTSGLVCTLTGKYYHRIGYGEVCFLSSKGKNFPEIILPSVVHETITAEDETFGTAVGGIFGYADYDAEIECKLHQSIDGVHYLSEIYSITLKKDNNKQSFTLPIRSEMH